MHEIPTRGMIVNPWPFLGHGPPPCPEMRNALLGLIVDLTPVNDTSQGSLFTADYTVTVFSILNGLREKRWSNRQLMAAFHFWSRRYHENGLDDRDRFAVPRNSVNTDPAVVGQPDLRRRTRR